MFLKERALRNLVSWSIAGDSISLAEKRDYTRRLLEVVDIAQFDCEIPQQYRIECHSEWQQVEKFIEQYQLYLSRLYFDGALLLPKGQLAEDPRSYFMLHLYNYLCDLNKDNAWVSRENSATVSCKLWNITYRYCVKSKVTSELMPKWAERQIQASLWGTIG